MDPSVARILDVNFNRAREALRVLEEHARLAMNDAALSQRAKQLRHDLSRTMQTLGELALIAARDIHHDVGTTLSTHEESRRSDAAHVARAAAKRAAESFRCLEEYGKIDNPHAAAAVEKLRYELYDLEQAVLVGGPRRARLHTARLHVLITEALCRGPWMDVCKQALDGGADVLQLREKKLTDRELLARARQLRELTAARGALLIINDRPDIARLSDADGVHLGQTDMPVDAARRIVGPNLLIGKSTHSLEEARAALSQDIDYLAVGPMFASPTKPDARVQGPALLAGAIELSVVPLVAIGGISPENVAQLLDVASSIKPQCDVHKPRIAVAICHSIIDSPDPAATARLIGQHFENRGCTWKQWTP